MNKAKETEILEKAIEYWGIKSQQFETIEAMSTLTQTLCQHELDSAISDNIAEDIADVEIMLDQMKLIYKNHDKVKLCRKRKIGQLGLWLKTLSEWK